MHALVPLAIGAVLSQAPQPAPSAPAAAHSSEERAVGDQNPYAATFAAEGTAADTFVSMHNRRGLRIELNLDKKTLELWISPSAGRSLDYRDRNFSNRDDHTAVFDRVSLPQIERKDLLGCDYDPFHSVLRFKDQTLHVATLFDRPVVVLWFERPSLVDLKSDKQDRFLRRTASLFEIEHPDRGRSFRFVAALGAGEGSFAHQRDVDEGRSTYARAALAPGQLLVLAGELEDEPVADWARQAAETAASETLAGTEAKVERALAHGRLRLRGRGELQRVLDLNRRVLLSMQDESGAIRAAIKYIYYLIWVRDGAIITVPAAYSGWLDPLTRWDAFLLANPTVTEAEPKGRFFGQLVNGRITKWEEDGLFYAVWSAFAHFGQTGDRRYASGANLAVLRDATDWLERLTYDRSRGLFGRYHDGETPFAGSRGDGWDDAVGSPAERFVTKVQGHVVTRSFDLAMNVQVWGVYTMLAAMDEERGAEYAAKARALEAKLRPWLAVKDGPPPNQGPVSGGKLPDYGELQAGDGVPVRPSLREIGMSDTAWALSLTPLAGEVFDLPPLRQRLFAANAREKNPSLATYFSLLGSLDGEFHDEAQMLAAIDRAVPEAVRPGRFLPMAYTAPEVLGIEDGHPYHDVRPQAFSVGPWLWSVANLGLRRLPFGIAVRATTALDGIDGYEYRRSAIDVRWEGLGQVERVLLNGKLIAGSLQIPDSLLVDGKNALVVGLGSRPLAGPVLVSSTVRLESVKPSSAGDSSGAHGAAVDRRGPVTYAIEGLGRNVLVFRGRPQVRVRDAAGRAVRVRLRSLDRHTAYDFEGRGRFQVVAR